MTSLPIWAIGLYVAVGLLGWLPINRLMWLRHDPLVRPPFWDSVLQSLRAGPWWVVPVEVLIWPRLIHLALSE